MSVIVSHAKASVRLPVCINMNVLVGRRSRVGGRQIVVSTMQVPPGGNKVRATLAALLGVPGGYET